jgi:3-dehydroquinate synthase
MNLKYLIGQYSLTEFSQWLEKQNYSSCIVLTDQNTSRFCYPVFAELTTLQLNQIVIPAGEKNKNIQSCELIWKELLLNKTDRKSLLINIGGGMLTDMGGFCAGTYMRGIDYVNIPTTLLGMVDAAIGGKTGVDLDLYKNMIGNFYEPKVTVVHPGFLKTLDQRQINAAYGEIIKYNLLLPFIPFDELFKTFGSIPDDTLIRSCINSKIEVVRDDPYETKGIREILNLGHTFGHAFETLSIEIGKDLLHGEAVALGILAEMILSENIYTHKAQHGKFIEEFILENYDKNFISDSDKDRIMSIIRKDKKNVVGKYKFILIDDHGKIKPVFVPEDEIKKALEQFIQL